MTLQKIRSRQTGDTLVEVLICVLLISVILGGAYTTVRRSTVGIRNSQEHAEALKAVQSQVEQLHSSAATGDTVFTAGEPFCMVDGVPVSSVVQPDAAKCTQDGSGNPTTDEPAYKLSITRSISGSSTLFTVTGAWNAITGSQSQETIVFRMHQ